MEEIPRPFEWGERTSGWTASAIFCRGLAVCWCVAVFAKDFFWGKYKCLQHHSMPLSMFNTCFLPRILVCVCFTRLLCYIMLRFETDILQTLMHEIVRDDQKHCNSHNSLGSLRYQLVNLPNFGNINSITSKDAWDCWSLWDVQDINWWIFRTLESSTVCFQDFITSKVGGF